MNVQGRHRRSHPPYPMEQCWYCQRDKAYCRAKIRFATWLEADEWVTEFNESRNYVDTVWRYHCDWCSGWHMYAAKDKEGRKKVERARRQWLLQRRAQSEQLDGDTGAGGVEQQLGSVRRDGEHAGPIGPVAGQ